MRGQSRHEAGGEGIPIIAYVWTPYFATVVARRAGPPPGPGPLALLDEHSRVLAADVAATAAGVLSGLGERATAVLHNAPLLLVEGRLQRAGSAVSVLAQRVEVPSGAMLGRYLKGRRAGNRRDQNGER